MGHQSINGSINGIQAYKTQKLSKILCSAFYFITCNAMEINQGLYFVLSLYIFLFFGWACCGGWVFENKPKIIEIWVL